MNLATEHALEQARTHDIRSSQPWLPSRASSSRWTRDEVLVQLGHKVGYGASLEQPLRMRGARVSRVGTLSRTMKFGKESITGLIVALERFVARDDEAVNKHLAQGLEAIAETLKAQGLPLATRLIAAGIDAPVPLLELTATHGSAQALSQQRQQGDPPVHLVEPQVEASVLSINPQTLRAEDDNVLVRCRAESFRKLSSATASNGH